jgi:hypothetical protein
MISPYQFFMVREEALNLGDNMNLLPRGVFQVCPEAETSRPVARRTRTVSSDEYSICRADGEILRICRGMITYEDVIKAAKCAKINGDFRIYTQRSCAAQYALSQGDFPIKKKLYISKYMPRRSSSVRRTQVFSVCETTTVAPVRPPTPPAPSQKNAGKKKLLNTTISALKMAISSLEELSRTL